MRLKIRCDGKSTVLLQKILEPNGALGSHFHKTRLNRTFGGSLAGTSIQFNSLTTAVLCSSASWQDDHRPGCAARGRELSSIQQGGGRPSVVHACNARSASQWCAAASGARGSSGGAAVLGACSARRAAAGCSRGAEN
jgi:hypothetical protein